MSTSNGMVVITDLITLKEFFAHAIRTLGGIDKFEQLSVGADGIQELAKLFENDVKVNQTISTFQVAETPLSDNAAGFSKVTFACTIMIIQKMDAKANQPDAKMQARNHTWKKSLRLIGLIRQAAEWYSTSVTEVHGEPYEVMFTIFQDKVLPLGKIVNANTEGWLMDIDVCIPVNRLLYV